MRRLLDYWINIPLVWLASLFQRKNTPPVVDLKKILIIKLAAIGDTILLIPPLRRLRSEKPHMEIHWLVSGVNQTIASTVPYVDRVIVLNPSDPKNLISLLFELRNEHYDLVIDFEQWSRGTALISYFTGAQDRIGFDTVGQHRTSLYTQALKKSTNQHEIDAFYSLLNLRFPLIHDKALELWETEGGKSEWSRIKAEVSYLNNGNKHELKMMRVLIHPGCGADGTPREWPLANYAVLGHWLIKKFNAQIFLSSGPEETKKTADLNKLLQNRAFNVGGKLSWLGTISMVKDMDLVISGNTGIMHVAAAWKKFQVALHGPTNHQLWGPINPNALVIRTPCPQCPCLNLGFEYHTRDQSCMAKIGIDTVKLEIDEMFASHISTK